jgi:hypothetical protein
MRPAAGNRYISADSRAGWDMDLLQALPLDGRKADVAWEFTAEAACGWFESRGDMQLVRSRNER